MKEMICIFILVIGLASNYVKEKPYFNNDYVKELLNKKIKNDEETK